MMWNAPNKVYDQGVLYTNASPVREYIIHSVGLALYDSGEVGSL